MKRSAKRIAVQLGIVLLFMAALPAVGQSQSSASSLPSESDAMSIWQARRIVVMGNSHWSLPDAGMDRSSFRFTPETFEYDYAKPKGGTLHVTADLRTLEGVSFRCNQVWCHLTNEAGKGIQKDATGVRWYAYCCEWWEAQPPGGRGCPASCVSDVKSFAAAINRLRAFAKDTEAPLRSFTQQAAAWRALPSKPAIPEEIRLQRMLAEDAVKQSKPGEALSRYETGLELYPTWPQGRFNAALIAAELGFYTDAVEHMQAYLELVPEAPDAQAARDQIAMWQFRAKEAK